MAFVKDSSVFEILNTYSKLFDNNFNYLILYINNIFIKTLSNDPFGSFIYRRS